MAPSSHRSYTCLLHHPSILQLQGHCLYEVYSMPMPNRKPLPKTTSSSIWVLPLISVRSLCMWLLPPSAPPLCMLARSHALHQNPHPSQSLAPTSQNNSAKSYQLSAISYQLSAISYQQKQNSHYHAVLSSSLMPSKPRPTIHPPPPGEHSPLPTAHRKPANLCSLSGSQLTRVTQLTQPCYLLSMLLAIAVV